MEAVRIQDQRMVIAVFCYLLNFAVVLTGEAPLLNVSFVAIGYTAPIGYSSLVYIGPAMSIGAEHIQKTYGDKMRISLHFLTDPIRNTCPDLNDVAVRLASEWHYRSRSENDLTVYLNNACVENSELPSFMSQWNALWISTQAASVRIRDRTANPTWISTHYFSQSQMSEFFISIFKNFQWSSIFLLVDTNSPPVYAVCGAILIDDLKREKSITVTARNVALNVNNTVGIFSSVLKDVKNFSRIVLFFGHNTLLREFLIAAATLNMTNGEYVYFAFEGLRNRFLGKFHWMYGDANDQVALQAFQSLLVVNQWTERNTDDHPHPELGMEYLRRSIRDYNYTYDYQDQPFTVITDSYLAFTMVGTVLNESVSQGELSDLRNGRELARRFLNRTFVDKYGTFYVDGNGQRRTEFSVSYFSSTGVREQLLTRAVEDNSWTILAHIPTWGNSSLPFPPPNEPVCGYSHQKASCQPQANSQVSLAATCTVLVVFVVSATAVSYARYAKHKADEESLLDPWWQLNLLTKKRGSCSAVSSAFIIRPLQYGCWQPNEGSCAAKKEKLAVFNGEPVNCHTICKSIASRSKDLNYEDLSINRSLLVLLEQFRVLSHPNLCRFHGIDMDYRDGGTLEIAVVFECPSRGNLPDLYNSVVPKDFIFISSMIIDFLHGLEFIHCSSFGYHGRLSIFNCWIDKRFTLKLMNLATDRISSEVQTEVRKHHSDCSLPDPELWEAHFWLPPETERTVQQPGPKHASMQSVDIFSSGFIVYDILTRGSLWKKMQQSEIASAVGLGNPLFTAVDVSRVPEGLAPELQTCWDHEPTVRPTAKQLRKHLAAACPYLASEMNLFEKIQESLSAYSTQLEREVAARSAALREERLRCDALVSQILPKDIVTQLRAGLPLEAELFDCVTLSFTELHGVKEVANVQVPAVTIALIAEMEECIDRLTSQYDVYKVEAIGDTFLVASGLPQRIGGEHIRRMAAFALNLQSQESIMLSMSAGTGLRIGIHSGSCAAGVMGIRRPRYCLFGDTVNVASRMCTNGLPGRIHISAHSKELLGQFGGFHVQTRGLILVKGKHNMLTYWLTKDNSWSESIKTLHSRN